MRYFKAFVPGVMAMAVVAVLLAVPSASADVLCTAAPNSAKGDCEKAGGVADDWSQETAFAAEATDMKLTVEGSGVVSTISCKQSVIEFENTTTGANASASGNPESTNAVPGKTFKLEFFNDCTTFAGVVCTFSKTTSYTLRFAATNDKGDGKMIMKGTGEEITVKCGFNFECKYSPEKAGVEFTITGGNPAVLTMPKQPLAKTAGFGIGCGSGAQIEGTYKLFGSNQALWVATTNGP
jgi:hypothetical protein